MTIKFIAEPATRLAVLESGEVDVIELVPEEEVSRLATDPKYTVRKASVPGLPEQLWFNTEKTPTNELAVRQAFNYAIDRQTIAATISFNVAPVCYGPLSETTLCFDQDLKKDYPYPYDPEKAMQILEQAGWVAGQDGIREKDGQRLEVVMTKSASIAPYMELIQAMLRDIGADVSIADMSFGSKFEMNARGDFQMTHMAWVSKDPSVLESTFHSKNIPEDGGPGYAFTRFRDESLDRAIEESLIALDMQERCALVEDAQQTIMKNALIVPLYDLCSRSVCAQR